MELENFIRNVSDTFEEKYDVKLQPILCENLDSAMARDRKQEEYNDRIRGCDFCFFLFYTKAGTFTLEEFEIAYEQFKATKKPKIYTFFKVLHGETAEQSLIDFTERLGNVIQHYYNAFDHLDTVKLRMLLCVNLAELDFVNITAKGNTCFVDGEAVMALDNVAEFRNNPQLQKLLGELEDTEEQCRTLKKDAENGDQAAYTALAKLRAKRLRLLETVEDLRQEIFGLSLGIFRDSVHGTVTARQLKAFHFLESGDLHSAAEMLKLSDLHKDFEQEQKVIEQARQDSVRNYLRQVKMLIRILSMTFDYENRFADMEDAFKAAVPLALKEKTELDIAERYIEFLTVIKNDYPTAATVGEQLYAVFAAVGAKEDTLLDLCEQLVYVYEQMQESKKAETYRSILLQRLEALTAKQPAVYGDVLAEKYHQAAIWYRERKKTRQADRFYRKAAAVWEMLFTTDPARYAEGLLDLYNDLAVFYSEHRAFGRSEKACLRAVAVFDRLCEQDRGALYDGILCVYRNLRALYGRSRRKAKEILYLGKTVDLLERLADGSVTATYSFWGFDDKTFLDADALNTDEPLKIGPAMQSEQKEAYPAAQFIPELASEYLLYGALTNDQNTYFPKAHALALKAPEVPACQQVLQITKPWMAHRSEYNV